MAVACPWDVAELANTLPMKRRLIMLIASFKDVHVISRRASGILPTEHINPSVASRKLGVEVKLEFEVTLEGGVHAFWVENYVHGE
jgi:hypothetical protein